MTAPDPTVPDPYNTGVQPAAEKFGRRAVVAKLAYVVPAIAALEVGQPAVALGRSGPTATRGKAVGHSKGKSMITGRDRDR
jgi:hypothetical protein